MSNPIIMLAGLPGTGKSTIAKRLEDRLDYDLHSLLKVKRYFGHKRYRPKQNRAVLQELYERTEQSIQRGKGVILDSNYSTQVGRQTVYEIVKNYGVDVLVMECYNSEREAKRRMRQRPTSDGLVVEPRDTKAYDKIAQRWQDINQDFQLFQSVPISYVRYNSETNYLQEMQVNPKVRQLVDRIKEIIKS